MYYEMLEAKSGSKEDDRHFESGSKDLVGDAA
jgi:hypothetical protein